MILTIVLRKEVADIEQAQTQAALVRQRLAEFPDVDVKATCSCQIEEA